MTQTTKTTKTDTKMAESSKQETGLERPATLTQAEMVALGEMDETMIETGKVEEAFMTLDAFKEFAKKSKLTLRKVARLKSGQSVQGIYVGRGPDIELAPRPNDRPDPKTGEILPKVLKTYGVQISPRIIVDLMGSFQLDREFAGTQVAQPVAIACLGQVETRSGQRVNDYHFLRPGKSIEQVIEEARQAQAKEIEAHVVETTAQPVQVGSAPSAA